MTEDYLVPDLPSGSFFREEETVKRSRFIVTVGRAASPEAAHAFIEKIREEHSQATHNCWAFNAGEPGSTAQVGASDDGEPKGTAGRPMLTAVLHSGIGEVVVVVTRYFGGIFARYRRTGPRLSGFRTARFGKGADPGSRSPHTLSGFDGYGL